MSVADRRERAPKMSDDAVSKLRRCVDILRGVVARSSRTPPDDVSQYDDAIAKCEELRNALRTLANRHVCTDCNKEYEGELIEHLDECC